MNKATPAVPSSKVFHDIALKALLEHLPLIVTPIVRNPICELWTQVGWVQILLL